MNISILPNNVESNTFYKSIILTIHGLPKGDPNFKPSVLYDIFCDYVDNKQNEGVNIVGKYEEFISLHGKSFLSRMLIELLDNISNGRICCTHCKLNSLQAPMTK